MHLPRQLKSIVIAGFTVVIAIFAAVFVYHFRPLLPTSEWRITAERTEGGELRTAAYRMFGRPHILFVELKGTDQGRYRWFCVDTKRRFAAVPNGPGRIPYLHFNHDMELGITLDDAKLEDSWQVIWNEDRVSFTNKQIAVALEPTKG